MNAKEDLHPKSFPKFKYDGHSKPRWPITMQEKSPFTNARV